jgi:hypothetical protein
MIYFYFSQLYMFLLYYIFIFFFYILNDVAEGNFSDLFDIFNLSDIIDLFN